MIFLHKINAFIAFLSLERGQGRNIPSSRHLLGETWEGEYRGAASSGRHSGYSRRRIKNSSEIIWIYKVVLERL